MAPKRIPAQIRSIDSGTEQIRITDEVNGHEIVVQVMGNGRKRIRIQAQKVFAISVEPREPVQDCLPKNTPPTA